MARSAATPGPSHVTPWLPVLLKEESDVIYRPPCTPESR